MKKRLVSKWLLFIALSGCFFTCDKNNASNTSSYSGPNEPAIFINSPIEVSKINFLLSLGWIQPSGHTIPTDHVYFWYNKPNTILPLPVFALASAKIEKILSVPVNGINECKIWFRMNEKFSYYLDHVVPVADLKEGTSVIAGQQVGTTGLGNSIDVGVIDENIALSGFVNPDRYVGQTLHCGKPFTYFTAGLQNQLYPLVDREGNDKDGKIDIDIPGKLVGSWFLDGPVFYTDGPSGWDKELSFAFDIQHPSVVLVSIGGTLGMVGKWTIQPGAPLPTQVAVSSGKIAYQLYSAGGIAMDPNQRGLMILQMIDDKHVKVEVLPDSKLSDASFSVNAKTYAR